MPRREKYWPQEVRGAEEGSAIVHGAAGLRATRDGSRMLPVGGGSPDRFTIPLLHTDLYSF
jgi:hypothetical protein